ncbi:hypothetical protein [Bradyrhizobium sp. SBR1B]|uniref:hypothetical protein n=1 Tax=Bradyrhizobium sp. SBR1B TaxID=2663836 RepID=UPI00182BBA8D|nr:hypothetical protein [Bradyrhizobium sp. SBR1B]MBB4381779.1 hypothetical protein [Bradyrhizobium sp. SBR1B]
MSFFVTILHDVAKLRCDGVIEVTQSSRNGTDAKLLSEAIAALRELVSRAQDATDESFDDGHSVDTWKSEEFRAAIERAEAVIAKAEAAMAEPRPE